MRRFLHLILLALIGVSLFSCRSVEPMAHEVYHHDTILSKERDSIYFKLSDTVYVEHKGDTICIEKVKWRDRYHEIYKGDTIVRCDSIYVKDNVVQYQMNGGQRFFFWIGIIACVLLILFIVLKFLPR